MSEISIENVVPMQATPDRRDRLTVLLRAYHQHTGTDPVAADCKASHTLQHILQPVRRRFALGPAWQALPLLWLTPELAGAVIIENHDKSLTVFMSYDDGDRIHEEIDPRAFYYGKPNTELLRISASEPCEITVTIFPR